MSSRSFEDSDSEKSSLGRTKSTDTSKREFEDSFNTHTIVQPSKFRSGQGKKHMNKQSHLKEQIETVIEDILEDNEEKEKPRKKLNVFSDLKEDKILKSESKRMNPYYSQRSKSSESNLPNVTEMKEEYIGMKENPKKSFNRYSCLLDKSDFDNNSKFFSNIYEQDTQEEENNPIEENPNEDLDIIERSQDSLSFNSNSISKISVNSFINKKIDEVFINEKDRDYREIVILLE